MLITDAVLAMQGTEKRRYGWSVRRMYLTAIEVQQKSANTAQSLNAVQFFSRMNRAIQGYGTVVNDKDFGLEFRDAMMNYLDVWNVIPYEMRDAVELFNKMAQRSDLQDKPIGEGIMFPDWKIAAETGKVVIAGTGPERDPNIGSLAELGSQSWLLAEEQRDVEGLLTTADIARSEFRSAKEAWAMWYPTGNNVWATPEGQAISNRWHRTQAEYEETKRNIFPKFVAWHAKAARFGLGLSELVDDIPDFEQGRFHSLVAQIHKVYEASVDLLKTDNNGQEIAGWALWQDYFYRMAERLRIKASDFQKREDEQIARSVPAKEEEMSGPAASSVDRDGVSGPAASSSQEPESFEKKTKRVLLLPAFPTVPVSEEEQMLVAARRAEREAVEKRLAERAAHLTELFKHFAAEPTRIKEKLGQ